MTVTGVVRPTGHWVFGWVNQTGSDHDGRRLFRWTYRFSTRWTGTILDKVTYDGTPDSCPCESGCDGKDPGFVTEWTERTRIVSKWDRRWLLTWDLVTLLLSIMTMTNVVFLVRLWYGNVGGLSLGFPEWVGYVNYVVFFLQEEILLFEFISSQVIIWSTRL